MKVRFLQTFIADKNNQEWADRDTYRRSDVADMTDTTANWFIDSGIVVPDSKEANEVVVATKTASVVSKPVTRKPTNKAKASNKAKDNE
jgi:hypothetical protein